MNRKTEDTASGTPFPAHEDGLEHRLDDALDDTFPASDPVQIVSRQARRDAKAGYAPSSTRGEQGRLDEGLEETFPASDPVAVGTRKADRS